MRARWAALADWRKRSWEVVVCAALVGVATGGVVAVFERLVLDVAGDAIAAWPLWAIGAAPALGLALADLALRVPGWGASPATADEYLQSFHDPGHILGGRALASRMAAALATLGAANPMGMEGPSLYFGAAVGSLLQRRLPRVFATAERRTLLVAGAAAGVAAIFKAPATGVVFALEVPYRDDLARRMLLPALVAAASGYLTFVAVNGTEPLFEAMGDPSFTLADLGGAVGLGVVCGAGARLFAWAVRRAKQVAATTPVATRVVLAGAVLAGLFAAGRAATGDNLALTGGYNVVAWAADPGHGTWVVLAVLAVRFVGTPVAFAGGGVGGVFIPLVVAGTLTGRVVGGLVPSADTGLFTVIGAAAFLGAGYRVPLAAVVFVAEATGRPGFIVPGLLAAVAAELVMGSASVTAYQVDPSAPGAGEDPGT